MTTATATKPATAPVAPAPVLQANGVDVKPAPANASNVDTLVGNWLKAEAHYLDREVGALADNVNGSVGTLVDAIMVCDEKKVWKTLGYRSLKMWVGEVLDDKLQNWSKPARTSLVTILVSKGFSGTDVARMTGVSESTVSRDANAKPTEPSTPTSRARKTVDTVADKCDDAEKFPTADLASLAFDTLRSLDKQIDELAKRGYNVDKLVTGLQMAGQKTRGQFAPRSGASGTTSTGVQAKPAPKPASK